MILFGNSSQRTWLKAAVLMFSSCLSVSSIHATTIGPDAAWYTATNEPAAFENISATGILTLPNTDDGTITVPIGFNFRFYGTVYNSVAYNTNGLITFGGTANNFTNVDLNTSTTLANRAIIAACWDDWISIVPGSGVYRKVEGAAPNRRLIIQWHVLDHFVAGGGGTPVEVVFQAILYEGTNEILLQYLKMKTGDPAFDFGVSATVGIRNFNGHTTGQVLQWSFNQMTIVDGLAIRFSTTDADADGDPNNADNCPNTPNPDQADVDGDGIGNVCDLLNDIDFDNDGVLNGDDNCPDNFNPNQEDVDNDGIGNVCDPINDLDFDSDGVLNAVDNCPTTANPSQADCDEDGIGNVCDTDQDCLDSIEQGSFEPDWQVMGPRAILTSLFNDVLPQCDDRFAFLATQANILSGANQSPVSAAFIESQLALPAGTLDTLTPQSPVNGAAMKAIVQVNPGDTISFSWNFLTTEFIPEFFYNDLAFVTVVAGDAVLLADTFTAGFSSLPNGWAKTGYHSFSHTFNHAGPVLIGLGVLNQGDNSVPSALLIDCFHVERAITNQSPACARDLAAADALFQQPSPNTYVVTEGETISVTYTATDPDGDDLTAILSGPAGATLNVDNGASPLVAILSWTPTAADAAGNPHVIDVSFLDAEDASAGCGPISVIVNRKPIAICSGNITVEAATMSGTVVTLDGAASIDPDLGETLLYHWDVSNMSVVLNNPDSATPLGTFPIGVTMATLTVADGRGGVSTCDMIVTVQDTTPPQIMVTTDTASLWPPNHTMRAVRISIVTTDINFNPDDIIPLIVTVRSNESDDAAGNGDGASSGDVNGQNGYGTPVTITALFTYNANGGAWEATINLRAERAGNGVGRAYTIDVTAFDAEMNFATTSCVVVVPHDRRAN